MSIGTVLGIGGSLLSASASKKAAKAQVAAANSQAAVQKEMYDQTREDLSGYRGAGTNALSAVLYEMGLGARPTIGGTPLAIETIPGSALGAPANQAPSGTWSSGGITSSGDRGLNNALGKAQTALSPTTFRVGGQTFSTMADAQAYADANKTGGVEYGGFKESPGYQFAVQQGQDAIERSAANSGGLFSGETGKALTGYRIGMANQDYGNYFNRLMGLTTIGQNAVNMTGAAGQNYANGASNAFANMGNAKAAGYIGSANAINNGIGNVLGIMQYQNQTGGGNNATIFDKSWAAPGFWG